MYWIKQVLIMLNHPEYLQAGSSTSPLPIWNITHQELQRQQVGLQIQMSLGAHWSAIVSFALEKTV